MARLVEGVRTWQHDPNLFNITLADAVVLADGSIAVAYAGSDNSLAGQFSVGLLDQTADVLTAVSTTSYPDAPGVGFGFTAVRELDLAAGQGTAAVALLYMLESAIGSDANPGLLVQGLSGSTAAGTAQPVDAAGAAASVNTFADVVGDGAGGYRVFWTESTPATGSSGGIRMATLDAAGNPAGSPVTVVADRTLGGIIPVEANPVMVDAAARKGGGFALVWTETTPFQAPGFGQPRVVFQMLDQSGAVAGAAVEIDGTSAQQAQVLTLKGGGMVVAWLDFTPGDQGIWKAQMMSQAGAKVGNVFELSSTISTQEADLQLVALDNGTWAAAWRDMTNGAHLARILDETGAAKGGDFQAIDTDFDFIGGKIGLVARGRELITYMHGLNADVGPGFVLQGQTFSTKGSYGADRVFGAGNNGATGTAGDDRIDGGDGNDTVAGAAGTDTLIGGNGDDRLLGNAGMDQLTGGVGNDTLTGGKGPDSFVFTAAAEGGDTITDFDGTGGDRVIFHKAGFGGATAVLSGAAVNAAHVGLFYNTSTGEITFDADGSGAAARVLVATLTGAAALAFDDTLFI